MVFGDSDVLHVLLSAHDIVGTVHSLKAADDGRYFATVDNFDLS
jgi:hypothetical protein